MRRDVLRATAIYNVKLKELDNVEIIWNTTVEEIVGEDFAVTGLKLKNVITGESRTSRVRRSSSPSAPCPTSSS